MRFSRRQHPALTGVKLVGFIITLALLISLGGNLVGTLQQPTNLFIALAPLLIGYLAADFVSGTVHWFCDTFYTEETPFIGRLFIRGFREHHEYPQLITECDFLEQDSSNYFIMLPLLWLAWTSGGPDPDTWFSVATHAALFSFALGSIGTNLFHKWAHAERVPLGIRWLQRNRMILSPKIHRVHHRDYIGCYCVTSGWMNIILDGAGFFRRAESLIRWVIRRPALTSTPLSHAPDDG